MPTSVGKVTFSARRARLMRQPRLCFTKQLLFSEFVEVFLGGDQVNVPESQFFYFRIRRVIRRSDVRAAVVRQELTGLLLLPGRINSDRKSALCLNELHAGYIRITVSEVHHPSERYAPFILRDVLIYFLDVR